MTDFVPANLFNLIVWICGLSEEPEKDQHIPLDETRELKVLSICQDIVSLANFGAATPKNVALANFVRHSTGSAQLVSVLNKFGHGISHTSLLEHEVALAESQMAQEEGIPTEFKPGKFTTVCWDNNDFNEKTLSGKIMLIFLF